MLSKCLSTESTISVVVILTPLPMLLMKVRSLLVVSSHVQLTPSFSECHKRKNVGRKIQVRRVQRQVTVSRLRFCLRPSKSFLQGTARFVSAFHIRDRIWSILTVTFIIYRKSDSGLQYQSSSRI